ncbi:MAG TPA: 6-phosphofructokinase, partial [Blastocatellia bacterium]|nr:6-phosphofructokinase [Blastocatellia bacterium]
PFPFEAQYAGDLVFAAVNYLLEGGTGAIITLQGGEFHPVPFDEALDAGHGRGRQRFVDIDTESYRVARDYMVRLEPRDFEDEGWVKQLAEAGGLSPEELRRRFCAGTPLG